MKRKTEELSMVTDRCASCIYSTYVGAGETMGNLACYYVVHTHETRGCPAGDQCTKYVEGKALRLRNGSKRW